ncbi:GspH/FimT family pseudopilin [Pseudoalteromonas sp. S16_S37]|uniref:GspH/FimT family pseudopilin n=1 Tax=Pseudoalteromonas sp. S16_S37 TaxID=2720228 RepID=UPI001680F0A4|nr:prepilin-type N-terminal cleavage/methylation domain-containing protein [Pseudoalteromonas sp. S16_S37]MBD1584284.1 prepilin-type N-terminal cleavage/methylation domain-containing protein [Pseudoalteromonas sp. S16_S37]
MVVGSHSSLNKGFSLIELVVALGIISILALVAMPSFITQIKQDRLTNNANLLSAFYKYSRSEAVKQSKSVQLVDDNSSWLLKARENGVLVTINQFSATDSSIQISYVDRTISSTGEIDQVVNILVTDNDPSTTDYRFCILQSGQSWVDKAEENCI